MIVNTCLIYRVLSSASAVIRSWFIYELQKSTIAFSRNSLYTFYSRNPTCGIPPCLRISNRKYPPCPQNSIIVNPPTSPSEILKAVRGIVWIFTGIAHLAEFSVLKSQCLTLIISHLKIIKMSCKIVPNIDSLNFSELIWASSATFQDINMYTKQTRPA